MGVHAFSLAVHDMLKGSKVLSDTLDTTMEICKLIKFSPKREGLLNSIKADIHMDTPGIKMLCPTRWTVQGESFERIKDNDEALMLEWDICLEERLDTEMRARIIGVKAQMESFQYFFGLNLGATLLIQTDNLSKTLQKTQLSSVEGQHCANLVIRAITSMRSDEMFDLYFLNVKKQAKIHGLPEPSLPRHRNVPKRFEVGSGQSHQPSSAEEYFRRLYYEAIDLVTNAITQRFNQPGFKAYSIMETLLLNALKPGIDVTDELKYMSEKYADDVNVTLLKAQLPVFQLMLSREFQSFHEFTVLFKSLSNVKRT